MIPTVPVTVTASDQSGNPVALARVIATLDQTEIYQGFVAPEKVEAFADANGVAVLNLWPNALGVAGSRYRVRVINPDNGCMFLDVLAAVPNSPCNLHQILVQEPYPPIDAAQQALIAAQAALAPVTEQAAIATEAAAEAEADRIQTGQDAQATAADRTETGLDRQATAADRIATGQDRVQTGQDRIATGADRLQTGLDAQATAADRIATGQDAQATDADRIAAEQDAAAALLSQQAAATSANNSATSAGQSAGSAAQSLAIYSNTAAMQTAVSTAQAAASLAGGHAASASSVVQQDLSGINAAALHRSPNAVTAVFVYDTSKDSDGGAWTEKCQHTSWYNEPINGKWLGAQASEAAARAVSGATTGDYFQLTTDGKFYRLNATSGTTEVFRGNKRDFPRLAPPVAEAGAVALYDLTEPGRPLWGRWAFAAGTFGTITSTTAVGSRVFVGTTLGLITLDFARDEGRFQNATSDRTFRLIDRASGTQTLLTRTGTAQLIVNSAVNSVAATVLPDAPIDPVTGLRIPTIAVATNGGVSVIQHNGTVRNSSSTLAFNSITITPQLLAATRTADGTFYWAQNPGTLNASFALQTRTNAQAPDFNAGNTNGLIGPLRNEFIRRSATAVQKLRNHESDPARALAATITNTFNTGHQTGDIRRTYLADIGAGLVLGPELVTNGTFDSDVSGWTADNSVPTIASGRLVVTSAGAGRALAEQTLSGLIVGKTYRFYGQVKRVSGAAASSNLTLYTTANQFIANIAASIVYGAEVSGTLYFVATATSMKVTAQLLTPVGAGEVGEFDNISVTEVVADRSYKAQGATITGTLVKSEVASAAQLVAYSGFSAVNYAQEPYSADLDFGTGEWSASAWVNIPTANAAAATIAAREASTGAYIRLGITAGNLLTATAFDGTTTRTVTTTAAYNTGTWLKARVNYTTDGTLALLVNGQQVAATRGNPLLTLNNANAVLTIGNSFAFDAPFPGSVALLKLSATVPTAEQAAWMYEQEKHMFQAGAQCCLPDAGAIADLTYDEATDKWIAVSATNESEWSGLVRTSVTAVPAGSYTRAAAGGGVQLLARSTTSPGVDVTIPAYGLREELVKRAESAARLNAQTATYDYVGGFTANTTTGNTAILSVANLTYPTRIQGARVTGTGIPANATLADVSGTTGYLSAAATATGTAVQVNLLDFALPTGMQATAVSVNGVIQREGPAAAYTRLFDGFREVIRFAVAPGNTAWVQIQTVRSAA